MATKKYQVFVSSTYEDLKEERKSVIEALLQMNCFPLGMEFFNASDKSQWDVIKKRIDECDYYILIIAGRYGSIDETSGLSFTQREYEYARSQGVPTIAFLHEDVSSLPKGKTEIDPLIEKKLVLFRETVKKHYCKFWRTSDGLAAQVVLSLNSLFDTNPRIGWVKADQLSSSEAYAEIVKLRKEIDELNNRVHHYEENEPMGTENLAQGEDRIDLSFINYKGVDESYDFSWNELISLLAPHMLVECSETILKEALNRCFKFKMGYDSYWEIYDDSFQSVKVQMIALGMIRESSFRHSSSDTNAYWSLTPYGKKLMITLKAIKKS